MAEEIYSEYDPFARAYDRFWGGAYEGFIGTLDRLVLDELGAGARILDLCCGTGQLAGALSERNFEVLGVDGSQRMIERARKNAPQVNFEVEDARNFRIEPPLDLVISTYDSLNHIMEPDDLDRVFANVYRSLKPQGVFIFDLNDEEGFVARWNGSFGLAEDDMACIVRSSYDLEMQTGIVGVTLFIIEGERWERSDFELQQRCYQAADVQLRLAEVGFQEIHSYDSRRDLNLMEVGRRYFVARKSMYGEKEDETT